VTAFFVDRRNTFLPFVGGLVVLAWASLLLWEDSPYGRYIDHGQWTEIGLAANLCRAFPAGSILLPVLLYASGWLLMSAAMMLPTVMPLIAIFERLTTNRRNRGMLLALLVAGYLLIWLGFGLAAHVIDTALHALVVKSSWLSANGWIVGTGVLALAGLFQFSALKYHCLDKCRTPFSFVNEHWRGETESIQAFRLGLHHGIFCVGCCWAIMLLMFVVGTGSVGWMLMLGAIMAIEKNVSWGRNVTAPLGASLVAWSGVLVVGRIW
jgi:predicted metal-binding membrane protein